MGVFDVLARIIGKKLKDTIENSVSGIEIRTGYGYDDGSGEEVLVRRLEEVFMTEYPDCEVHIGIEPSEIEVSTIAKNYDYGLYRDDRPVALFNVIRNRNDYKKLAYREAKEIARRNGIPHMNFYIHLPNEKEYISNRIRNEING